MSPSEASASGTAGRRRKNSEPDDAGRSSRTNGRRRSGGRRKQEPRRFGRLIGVIGGVLVVALIGLGVVLYLDRGGEGGGDGSPPRTRPVAYSVSDSETNDINTVLATREADNRPLNEGELFGERSAEISSRGVAFTLRDFELAEDCSGAVWGDGVAEALAGADCTQAGRGTYVSDDHFGVVAIFNLADIEGSRAVAAAMAEPELPEGEESPADAPVTGFVMPPSGADPFDRLGSGYSAAEATISGHYLVVVWVQPTDSASVDERVSLASPLVTLGNFRDPLYRRLVNLKDDTDTTEPTGGTGVETTGPGTGG
ncbi:hypothetical protein [Nocardiopsis lambiniae]|uniref:Serine/threonine protein kinase n=1 Tax=Nocardiopsis lambiniae TaxID=3075539 RepID=A0ABU2MF25_9ACTN|nr:hypothetical protein [Nocardiopsis sp. DSM 44743]MDT0330486.1 hypothetical protein [Nocardiopsis sp. DSM 44743]